MIKKTSWREWLNKAGFDWNTGILVYQEPRYGDWDTDIDCRLSPFSQIHYGGIEKDPIKRSSLLDQKAEILDFEFEEDLHFPLIFAKDSKAIYIVEYYNGGSSLERISIDPEDYLNGKCIAPALGGN